MSDVIIGIDLGTTNSLVGYMANDQPQIFSNELGEELTPSVIAYAEDGSLLVGQPAKERLIADPDSGIAFFKRDMGGSTPYIFGPNKLSPTECSALILKEMKRIAELKLGHTVSKAVISVPAYFRDSQRNSTIEAATIAGLKVERIINEPTAAALAFGYKNPDKESNILVFDLGGGTFDVTLLEVFDGVIEVKASGGESHLGGEDYTTALMNHLLSKHQITIDSNKSNEWRNRLEKAKRALSESDSTELTLGEHVIPITTSDLTISGKELNARMRPIIKKCIHDAKLTPVEIDDIILVGGASRMTVIKEIVHSIVPTEPNHSVDPDRAIAIGACIQAALCARNVAVDDIVLTDVSPHTLGVEVVREGGRGDVQPGFFSPIISRNSTLPCSKSDLYHTTHPEQDQIDLKVFQGESRLTKDNHLLGTVVVKGLKARRNEEYSGVIDVRFTYDMNGILEVEVTILSTKKKLTKVFEQRPGTMTEKEIKEAMKRLHPLKIHPRDKLPNRTRLEKANRLYEALNNEERAYLSQAIDAFEAALDQQNDREIQEISEHLDNFMKQYDQLV